MCENFDHGIDPKSTVVEIRYKPNNRVDHEPSATCTHDQIRPSVTLTKSESMKRSARTMRNGEWPSAATSTRMKNQNQ